MSNYFELQNGPVLTTPSALTSPKITSIGYPGDDTAADTAGGQTITLTGQGFEAGASVIINTSAVGVVSVVSSTTITFTSPALATGSYAVYVINTDGGTAIAVPGIQYSGTPTWSTAAGSLGSYTETQAISNTVTATGDAPISYSLFSGTLPTGATLNSSTGLISGTSPLAASPTTYTFTIRATDAEQQDTNRSFSLTINPDVVTWSSPANGTTYTTVVDSAISNVALSATAASGQSVSYTANTLPTGLSISGSNITGTPTVVANSSSLLTATAATTNATATRTINWVISVASDSDFEYVTTLLSASNPTSTFVTDASTNNFAVTVNGDTRPNNFNPYTPGYYSAYFDGTGDYLNLASNSAFDMGSGDFTIEGWIYVTGSTSSRYLFGVGTVDGSTRSVVAWLGGTNNVEVYYSSTGNSWTSYIIGTTTIVTNIWYHIAFVKSGTTLTLYLNGVSQGSQSGTATGSAYSGQTVYVGGQTTSYPFNGYLSNVRIVKGTAVYTSNFTPSTTPLTAIANTSLLTCQSNRFIDNSTNAFTITRNGDTTISGFDPFAPNSSYSTYGSGYFDGTGDYITLPASQTNLQPGSGDFTIEFWYYTTTTPSGYINLFSYGTSGNVLRLFLYTTNSLIVWTGATPIITANNAHVASAWNHVAIVRSGTTVTLYVNGVSVGTSVGGSTTNYVGNLSIAFESGQTSLTGYMTDFRLVKGTAVYTGAFTPPAAPLTAIANTQLLTLQNNQPNNNNMFLDSSSSNFLITRNGNTTQGSFSPYGGGWSNYFDGNGDFLSLSNNSAFLFGSGDFTIECWVYLTAISATEQVLMCIWDDFSTTPQAWNFRVNTSGKIYFMIDVATTDTTIFTSTYTMTVGAWTHLAVTRSGNTFRLFVNGALDSTTTNSSTISNGNGPLCIGGFSGSSQANKNSLNGYISNARIVKGTAVYTGAFTPPTAPLTPIENTSLLTCADNRFVDDSANNFTITRNGDVSIQRFNPFNPVTTTPTSYSGYFDGNGDYLTTPASSNLDVGNVSWTIECWVYMNNTSGTQMILGYNNLSASDFWDLTVVSGVPTFKRRIANSEVAVSGGTISANVFTHVAVVRNGTAVTIYLNGSSVATNANLSMPTSMTDQILGIGANRYGSGFEYYFNGYISNIRIVKGTAVYTSNFTPSTTPLTAIANTSLLTLQSPTFVDNSTNNFTITANGNSQPTQFNSFGWTNTTGSSAAYSVSNYGGSMYFDGTDYLTLASSSAFNIFNGDMTVECWFYATSLANSPHIFAFVQDASNRESIYFSSSALTFYTSSSAGNGNRIATSALLLNTWYHMALVKSGSTFTLYLNGTSVGTSTTTQYSTSNQTLQIGTYNSGSYAGDNFTGYISNVRIVKGQAVYTSNFAPPVAPLSFNANAVLQVNGTGAAIYDSAMMATYETVGNAQSTGVIKKYGNSSMYFDGTGDYLLAPASQNIVFRTGNFTIECWLYLTATGVDDGVIIENRPSEASNSGFVLNTRGVVGGYKINFYVGGFNITPNSVTYNSWNHIAVTRSSGTVRIFLNGVIDLTATINNDFTSSSMTIGQSLLYANSNITGYMSDLRITKGVARYTSNFTPTTTPFLQN